MAIAVALFLATAGLAALSTTLSRSLDRERSSRVAIREAAARFTTRLLTYDYQRLDAAKTSVLELSTARFRGAYEKDFATLAEALTKTEARAVAKVTAVYLGVIGSRTASTIAVADAASETTAGTRQTTAAYFQLELVRTDGRWLVDRVVNLKFGDSAPVTPAPGATTTTVGAGRR